MHGPREIMTSSVAANMHSVSSRVYARMDRLQLRCISCETVWPPVCVPRRRVQVGKHGCGRLWPKWTVNETREVEEFLANKVDKTLQLNKEPLWLSHEFYFVFTEVKLRIFDMSCWCRWPGSVTFSR